MAIKFSQFDIGTASATAYVVGYDGSSNVRIPATDLSPSGTPNYIPKYGNPTGLTNSQIFDNGTSVGIGTASPSASYKLDVSGATRITNDLTVSTNAIINTIKIGVGLGNINTNIGIGASALSTTTTAQYNVVIGTIAGASLLNGNFNTIVGYNAGNALTTGVQNSFFGHNAGRLLSTSSYNTAFGQNAGRDITSGSDNVFVGQSAGFALSSGSGNVILGAASGGASRTGDHNIHIGYSAGINNNGGIQNIFIGKNVGTSVTAGSYNVIIGANNGSTIATSSNFMLFADGAGNERFRIPSTGNFLIGTTTDAGYKLDVNGTARVQGGELRLDNATTGTINIYSATPKVNFFSGGGYSIGRTSTSVELISGGNIAFYIGANQGYGLDATNGHLFRSAIAGSAALARLTTGGNLIVGGTTDAGFRADIQGTLRVSGTATFSGTIKTNTIDKNDQNNPLQIYTAYNNINAIIEFWGGTGARLQYNTNTRVLFPSINADISIGTSSLKFNNIYGTNGYFETVLGVGTTSPNASSILDLTSTTKGFLPPRMTTAQITAISTPAEGLIAYNTTISYLCVYQSGAWAKLSHSPM